MDCFHHISFQRLGAEKLSDLVGLCRGCQAFLRGVTMTDPKWTVIAGNLSEALNFMWKAWACLSNLEGFDDDDSFLEEGAKRTTPMITKIHHNMGYVMALLQKELNESSTFILPPEL
jgi:hypothetical protein